MIWVSVASNIDPENHIPAAINQLTSLFGKLTVSPFYETAPIDRPEQGSYWNGVVGLQTNLSTADLVHELRAVESSHGRQRGSDKWAARTLDLDVLIHDEFMDEDIVRRPFLARCLADLGALPPSVAPPSGDWLPVWQAQD